MHFGHDHDHHNGAAAHAGPGHNQRATPRPTQWQTPHVSDSPTEYVALGEPDLDLVETAFVAGFTSAPDQTSFLRLARVPFEAMTGDGTRLSLLRVEVDDVTDVGSLVPHLGGGSFRYDPLPTQLTSRRRRVRFVYFDGQALRQLGLSQARSLPEASS